MAMLHRDCWSLTADQIVELVVEVERDRSLRSPHRIGPVDQAEIGGEG